jgi:HNH endonuclease
VIDRLPDRVRAHVLVEDRGHETPCWVWQGYIRPRDGYPDRMRWHGRKVWPLRHIYEMLVGPIPEGLDLDHLCRVRVCVNPEHAEPVTRGENVRRGVGPSAVHARKTHCIHGHSLADAVLRPQRDGSGRMQRECRTCRAIRLAQWSSRRKVRA